MANTKTTAAAAAASHECIARTHITAHSATNTHASSCTKNLCGSPFPFCPCSMRQQVAATSHESIINHLANKPLPQLQSSCSAAELRYYKNILLCQPAVPKIRNKSTKKYIPEQLCNSKVQSNQQISTRTFIMNSWTYANMEGPKSICKAPAAQNLIHIHSVFLVSPHPQCVF